MLDMLHAQYCIATYLLIFLPPIFVQWHAVLVSAPQQIMDSIIMILSKLLVLNIQ